MKLLSKYEMSAFGFDECNWGNDTPEMRNLITDSQVAYLYCKQIRDIKEMWCKITDPIWISMYCRFVKDRPEVRKYVK